MTRRIVILGSGDVGSAIAHRLFLHGDHVILVDTHLPSHTRRGMAFADAWFDGVSTLEGVVGLMVKSLGGLPAHFDDMDAVPCTTEDVHAVTAALQPDALVDARMSKRSQPPDLRELAPLTLGLGPGFEPGVNCHLAIETAWGHALGAILNDRAAAALAGEPRTLGDAGRERFVYAGHDGIWRTQAHIGDKLVLGQVVGTLIGMDSSPTKPVLAPLPGCLRGLPHDGVWLRMGQKMLEVDPRAAPDTHGLGARPAAIARGVARALSSVDESGFGLFGFERTFAETLDCMPMNMRRKLDLCGLKLPLENWRQLPQIVRETLLETSLDHPYRLKRIAPFLRRQAAKLEWPELATVFPEAASDHPIEIPPSVAARFTATAHAVPSILEWQTLSVLQRYALIKLSTQQSGRNWCEALRGFGLTRQ